MRDQDGGPLVILHAECQGHGFIDYYRFLGSEVMPLHLPNSVSINSWMDGSVSGNQIAWCPSLWSILITFQFSLLIPKLKTWH